MREPVSVNKHVNLTPEESVRLDMIGRIIPGAEYRRVSDHTGMVYLSQDDLTAAVQKVDSGFMITEGFIVGLPDDEPLSEEMENEFKIQHILSGLPDDFEPRSWHATDIDDVLEYFIRNINALREDKFNRERACAVGKIEDRLYWEIREKFDKMTPRSRKQKFDESILLIILELYEAACVKMLDSPYGDPSTRLSIYNFICTTLAPDYSIPQVDLLDKIIEAVKSSEYYERTAKKFGEAFNFDTEQALIDIRVDVLKYQY